MNVCTEEVCLKLHHLLFFIKSVSGLPPVSVGVRQEGRCGGDLPRGPILVSGGGGGGAVHSRSGFSHHPLCSPAPNLISSPCTADNESNSLSSVKTRPSSSILLVNAATLLLFFNLFWSLLPHRRRRHGTAVGLSAAVVVVVAAAAAALRRQLISRTFGGTIFRREIEIPIFLAVRRRHRGVLRRRRRRDPLLYRDRSPFCRRVERTYVAGADRMAAAAAAAGILAEVGVRRCCGRRVSLLLSSRPAPSATQTRSLGRRSAPNAKSVFKNVYFAFIVLHSNRKADPD